MEIPPNRHLVKNHVENSGIRDQVSSRLEDTIDSGNPIVLFGGDGDPLKAKRIYKLLL